MTGLSSQGDGTNAASGHLRELAALVGSLDSTAIDRVYRSLCVVRDAGATVYIAGNGGSAATAGHWANDLVKAGRRAGGPPMRAVSLGQNVSSLTALANDEGYDRVFSGQLENLGRPEDLLVVISASGNSPNLVRAVEAARARGIATVGILGFDGGVLKSMVGIPVWVPTDRGAYELAEDCHSAICHALSRCVGSDVPSRRD